jgi:hypothetical protein
MKNKYLDILILMIILCTVAASAIAQNDTVPRIPLYENAVATDAPPVDNHHVVTVGTGSALISNDDLRNFYNYYSAGKFREAINLSKKLSTEKLNKTQHQVYQKYTVAAYKEMEYNKEADSVMQAFREKYPFYQPNYYDPASFREIFDNYYTMPKFSLWVATASPMVQTIIDTVYVITIDTLQRKPDYSYDAKAVQLGFEYHPLKFLSVSFAPTMLFYSYNRSSKRHEFATHYYKERYMTLCLPLRVEAGLYRKREFFVPSVFIGAQTKYVLRSQYTSYIDVIGQVTEVPDEQSDLDSKTRLNYSLFGGVRLSFNCNKRFTYFAEASASADMLPVNNPDKKYASRDALYRDLYINDAYRLRELSLMVGVKVNLKYKTVAKNGYGYVKK